MFPPEGEKSEIRLREALQDANRWGPVVCLSIKDRKARSSKIICTLTVGWYPPFPSVRTLPFRPFERNIFPSVSQSTDLKKFWLMAGKCLRYYLLEHSFMFVCHQSPLEYAFIVKLVLITSLNSLKLESYCAFPAVRIVRFGVTMELFDWKSLRLAFLVGRFKVVHCSLL